MVLLGFYKKQKIEITLKIQIITDRLFDGKAAAAIVIEHVSFLRGINITWIGVSDAPPKGV